MDTRRPCTYAEPPGERLPLQARQSLPGALERLVARRGGDLPTCTRKSDGMSSANSQFRARHSYFRIYSMNTTVTSIALISCMNRAVFCSDDPVSQVHSFVGKLRVYKSGIHPQFLTTAPQTPVSIRRFARAPIGLTYGFMNRTNVEASLPRAELEWRQPAIPWTGGR